MLIPMLLGYVLGGVGVYCLLTKYAPVVNEDPVTTRLENNGSGEAEIIELFPQHDQRKVA